MKNHHESNVRIIYRSHSQKMPLYVSATQYEPMNKEKAWISFEIDKEMFDALCEHSERVTLPYELVIKELIRNVLHEKPSD